MIHFIRRGGSFPRVLTFLGVGLFLTSWACRGEGSAESPDLQLDVSVSPTPPMVGPAQVVAFLTDTTGAPLTGAQVLIRGDMTHAGMSPVIDTAEEAGPGRYAVQDFRFTMAGDWILTVQASLEDGRSTSVREPVSVLTPPPGLRPDSGMAPRAEGDGSGPVPR